MQILTGKIGTGKTIGLIELAHKNNGILVVWNNDQGHLMKDNLKCLSSYYNDITFENIPVITYNELINKKLSGKNKDDAKYYIDRIELFLEMFKVSGFSCDGENVIIREKTFSEPNNIYSNHLLIKANYYIQEVPIMIGKIIDFCKSKIVVEISIIVFAIVSSILIIGGVSEGQLAGVVEAVIGVIGAIATLIKLIGSLTVKDVADSINSATKTVATDAKEAVDTVASAVASAVKK